MTLSACGRVPGPQAEAGAGEVHRVDRDARAVITGATGGRDGPAQSASPDVAAHETAAPDVAESDLAVDRETTPDQGPAASDCPAGALICDDFESYAPGGGLTPRWSTQELGGTVTLDSSRPFRGARGLHLNARRSLPGDPGRTNGGPLRAASIVKEGAPLFPVAGNAFFGRVMIWLTKMPPGGVHFSNIEASGRLPDNRLAKYGEGGMFERLMAGYTVRPKTELDQPTVDCPKSAATGVPEKRWVCVEWHFDGANDEMHYWFDGQLQTGVDVSKGNGGCGGPWKAPVFDKLFIGWRHSQPSPIDVDMWIDDVVIATKRIGCPAP